MTLEEYKKKYPNDNGAWVANVWESERGWGQKPFFKSYYKTEEEARTHKEPRDSDTVPEWYTFVHSVCFEAI